MGPFKNNSYRSDIDGLRAIAVLSVVGFHAFPGLIHGGFIGVDVFFVISGFLISTILLNDLIENRFSLAHFFARRIRRIFPTLILVLLACFIAGWLDLLPDEFQQLGKHIAGGAGFIDNFLYWYEIGYFDQSAETKPLLHLWSLGVEEQFYLIFPLILWLGFQKTWNIKVFYVLFLASFALNIWLSFTAPSAAFFLPFSRFWEFLIGFFVAIELSQDSKKTFIKKLVNENSQIISVVGFVLLAITFMGVSPKSIFPGFWALLPTIGTALILLTPQSNWINRRLLSNSLVVKLGLISYPLYLWHWPLLSFAHIMQGEAPSSAVRLIAIGIAIALSWISYKYIELPIRFGKSLKYKTQSLVVIMVFVCGLGIATAAKVITTQFMNVEESLLNKVSATRSDDLQQVDRCFLLRANADDLSLSDCAKLSESDKNVLLIGDSHAASLYPGLKRYLSSKNVNLSLLTAAGCLPIVEKFPINTSETATKRCEDINKKIRGYITSSEFDLIVISSYLLEWGFNKNLRWTYPKYYEDLLRSLNELNVRNKILFVGPFVTWPAGLPTVLKQEINQYRWKDISQISQISTNGISPNLIEVDLLLGRDIPKMNIEYLSIVKFLCDTDGCRRLVSSSEKKVKMITFDSGHLGIEGSEYLSENLIGPSIINLINQK